MKRTILIAISLVAIASVAMAQGPGSGPRGQGGGHRGQFLDQELTKIHATPAQSQKVKDLYQKTFSGMQGMRNMPDDQRRAAMEKSRTQIESGLKSILTAAQYKQWQADMASMRGRMGGGGMGMFRELNLNNQQQGKLKVLMANQRTKMDEIRNNKSLSDAQKKQEMKTLHEQTQTQIQAILTPDQWKKFQAMRQHGPRGGGPGGGA